MGERAKEGNHVRVYDEGGDECTYILVCHVCIFLGFLRPTLVSLSGGGFSIPTLSANRFRPRSAVGILSRAAFLDSLFSPAVIIDLHR